MDTWLQSLAWLLPWVPLVALGITVITLGISTLTFGTLLFTRWLDSRTRLKITYRVGKPEHPADLNDIPAKRRPDRPALFVKVHVKGAMDVRLQNVFIKTSLHPGVLDFEEGIGNIRLPSKKSPGDHWLFYQNMEELVLILKKYGYPRFKIVVRDGTGRKHAKRIKIPDIESWLPQPPQPNTQGPP